MAYEELKTLLQEVSKHIRPQKVKTLFSLGGRGHYENPVSDLLAFFMDPAAEHGLGSTFLAAFLECLSGEKFRQLPLERVWISREEETDKRKRIDLVIRGNGWMMLIENKIYHWLANPFLDYKEHFKKQNSGTEPYMVVLSPNGDAKEQQWMGVSYKTYCQQLHSRLHQIEKRNLLSKWVVFARELILHLENELYTAPMENKAIEFIEDHWQAVSQVQKLAWEYRAFLLQELKNHLIAAIEDSSAYTKDDQWAIRCYGSRWGQANIAWWYDSENIEKPINFTVYIPNPTAGQNEIAQREFESKHMKPVKEANWIGWRCTDGFTSRVDAMNEFVRLAIVVEKMLKTTEAPAEPAAVRMVPESGGAEN